MGPMDKSIRYVREHRIAPLLNDLVMHLLVSKPEDPIPILIAYLEKQQSPQKDEPEAAKSPAKPPRPPAAEAASPAADRQADASADALPKRSSTPISGKRTATPNRMARSSAEVPEMVQLLNDIASNEAGLRALLADASGDDAVRSALTASREISELTANSRSTHETSLLEAKISRNPDVMTKDFLSGEAFRLAHEIDTNELEARAVFRTLAAAGVDVSKLSDAATLDIANRQHKEILSLVEESEKAQIAIEARLNGGLIGEGALHCLGGVAKDVANITRELVGSVDRFSSAIKARPTPPPRQEVISPRSQPSASPRNATPATTNLRVASPTFGAPISDGALVGKSTYALPTELSQQAAMLKGCRQAIDAEEVFSTNLFAVSEDNEAAAQAFQVSQEVLGLLREANYNAACFTEQEKRGDLLFQLLAMEIVSTNERLQEAVNASGSEIASDNAAEVAALCQQAVCCNVSIHRALESNAARGIAIPQEMRDLNESLITVLQSVEESPLAEAALINAKIAADLLEMSEYLSRCVSGLKAPREYDDVVSASGELNSSPISRTNTIPLAGVPPSAPMGAEPSKPVPFEKLSEQKQFELLLGQYMANEAAMLATLRIGEATATDKDRAEAAAAGASGAMTSLSTASDARSNNAILMTRPPATYGEARTELLQNMSAIADKLQQLQYRARSFAANVGNGVLLGTLEQTREEHDRLNAILNSAPEDQEVTVEMALAAQQAFASLLQQVETLSRSISHAVGRT